MQADAALRVPANSVCFILIDWGKVHYSSGLRTLFWLGSVLTLFDLQYYSHAHCSSWPQSRKLTLRLVKWYWPAQYRKICWPRCQWVSRSWERLRYWSVFLQTQILLLANTPSGLTAPVKKSEKTWLYHFCLDVWLVRFISRKYSDIIDDSAASNLNFEKLIGKTLRPIF